MRPLTKNGDNGTYVKYYPSSPFLPSVALGALLTTNLFLVIRVRRVEKITLSDTLRPFLPFYRINRGANA